MIGSRATALLLIFLMFASLLLTGASKQSQPAGVQTFTGEIIDTICAEYRGHLHMMQEMKSMGTDKVSCTQKCIQLGAKYALYDAAKQTVYGIQDQDRVSAFAGRQVQITGTLNKKKIKISEIKASD
jgi:hypothetical protein